MSRAPETVTRGVVIGRMSAGEGSMRVLIYTEALGLVAAVAKSAREERSKLRAHLTAGTFGTYVLVKGESFWRVTGATATKNSHFMLTEVPVSQEASARVIGVVRQLVHGEGSNDELFTALWNFLHTLPTADPMSVMTIERQTVLAMLASLGYVAPEDQRSSDIVSVINKGLMASGLT